MAVKDLQKVPRSLFVVAISFAVVVGLIVLYQIIPSTNDDSLDTFLPENVSTVNGTIDALVEDCVRNERLRSDGQIVSDEPVACDAGSYISIDDILIQTSAGFVPQDHYFSYDISELNVGQVVSVTYQRDDNGFFNLDCEVCLVQPLN